MGSRVVKRPFSARDTTPPLGGYGDGVQRIPSEAGSTITVMPSSWQTLSRAGSEVAKQRCSDRATSAARQSARLTGHRVLWYWRARSLPAATATFSPTGQGSSSPSSATSKLASSSSAPLMWMRWSRTSASPTTVSDVPPAATRTSTSDEAVSFFKNASTAYASRIDN